MAYVFLSYAREDKETARRLADAIKAHGWSVWWDTDIPPGKTWDEIIERELSAARCAVVMWSETSVGKTWVRTEASEALKRGILIPVLIHAVEPPIAFRLIQAASLVGWHGDEDHPGFRQLLGAITSLAEDPSVDALSALADAKTEPQGALEKRATNGTALRQLPSRERRSAEKPKQPDQSSVARDDRSTVRPRSTGLSKGEEQEVRRAQTARTQTEKKKPQASLPIPTFQWKMWTAGFGVLLLGIMVAAFIPGMLVAPQIGPSEEFNGTKIDTITLKVSGSSGEQYQVYMNGQYEGITDPVRELQVERGKTVEIKCVREGLESPPRHVLADRQQTIRCKI